MSETHVSVMPQEALEYLNVPAGGVVVDGTLGLAGHSCLIAQKLGQNGHLIGIDRDVLAIKLAQEKLAGLTLQKDLCQGDFADIQQHLSGLGVTAVDGILLDLGISSFQLDNAARGFAFSSDGPLDMRMDPANGKSAADLVNALSEGELTAIIEKYGEDRFAKRIARAIVYHRAEKRIERTEELAQIVLRALPKGYTRGRIHPATRTFQALRIEVNDELGSLQRALSACLEVLKPGGRLCVISFHSLEDRIVKQSFKRFAEQGQAVILTKRPLVPTEIECETNPRSRSAKLRAIEKI